MLGCWSRMMSVVEGVGLWLRGDGEQRWSRKVRSCGAHYLGVKDKGHIGRDKVEHSITEAPGVASVLSLVRRGRHGEVGDVVASTRLGVGKVHMLGWLTTTWSWLLPVMVSLEGQVTGLVWRRL